MNKLRCLTRRGSEVQWSQIKTLFILCFLALNVYLLFQLYEQQEKHGIIDEPVESTFEEQLEQDKIRIPESIINAGEKRESFMTVEQKRFDTKELREFDLLKNQDLSIINETLIVSVLKESLKIPDNASAEYIHEFMKRITPFHDEYALWRWDKELNMIIFFQQKKNQPIYYNGNGLLLLYLNDENEIIFYSQRMLGEEETNQEAQKLISPLRAIETIYNSGQLIFGDEIVKAEVGYHTRIHSADRVQVFVPTWKVVVNDEKYYFVNAIEGYVFSSNEHEFLSEILNEDFKNIQSSLGDSYKHKNLIENIYREKIDLVN